MIKNFCSLFLLLSCIQYDGYSQHEASMREGDSLYKIASYQMAANKYLEAVQYMPKIVSPRAAFYNAACCYALMNDTVRGQRYLDSAVFSYQYRNYQHLLRDADLRSLHVTATWKKVIDHMKNEEQKQVNPLDVELVTTDIHHFWSAYDKALLDTANRKKIFTEEYFDKASVGLQDYYRSKIGSIDAFMRNLDKKPAFYKAIRANTLAIDVMKPQIQGYLVRLKQLYPQAVFPDIYFVMGRWNSAGTVSENGMLLGVDQQVKSADIPTHELNLWEKNNFQDAASLPIIVTHELIHSQQMNLKEDTTLLFYAIVEGMADFMCELITGKQPSVRQHEFARTRKKEIWNRFKAEMHLERAYNWIGNGNQERPDHPADLGYYVGYEICKAYYERAIDKSQAIHDFFNITDYNAFLKKSGYEEQMNALP